MARYRLHCSVRLWVVLLLVGCCGTAAWAGPPRVREASGTIADSATRRVVEDIPDAGVDLPVVLPHPQDVYLLVTAGAAYTDVRVLGLPTADAARLAHALAAAETGTPLDGTDVSWSADTYAAARLVQKRGHWGRREALNTVPLGALSAGLRRAGFVPHTLLRVPVYAEGTGLLSAPYSTRRFRWYDESSLAGKSTITIRADLAGSPMSLWPLALLLLMPLLGITGRILGNRVARDEQLPLETRRSRFRAWTLQVPMLSIALTVPVILFITQSASLYAVADLWLGSSSAAALFLPVALLLPLVLIPQLASAHRREVRLFGKPPGAVEATWLTEEEKALQKRMARWRAIPHLIGLPLIVGAVFLVPHSGPLSTAVHPLYQLVAVLGAGVVSFLFRKQVAALTKKTLDDDLTFRARRFGQLLGVRPRDVWVEDSSRASHFAVAHLDKGDHLVVSRKMRDTFTPAEMDFVLAAQVARMVKGRRSTMRPWMLLTFLPLLLPVLMLSGHGSLASSLILSPWFFPVFFGAMVLFIVSMIVMSRVSARDSLQREQEADRRALEITGDLAAAQSALAKTDAEALPAMTGAVTVSSTAAVQSAGRLAVRRSALQRSGEASFG